MRKGIFPKLSMGVAMAAAAAVFSAPAARADLDNLVTYTEPAGTLVMPFDATTNKASFQLVTRVEGEQGSNPVATHWSFWSADCRHLVDIFICLTPDDTVVVDPTNLQNQVQATNPPANVGVGGTTDLTGEKGIVTVTAFEADTGPSGNDCRVVDPEATLQNLLLGFWTIANTTTNAAFGNDAIGLSSAGDLPDPAILSDGGIKIQTFNPQDLTDSEVILIGVEFNSDPPGSGFGQFALSELGPIRRSLANGFNVCCDTTFTDNLEVETSLPNLCFQCVGFNPISDNVAETGETSIIPASTTIDSPGFIHLRNCSVQITDGTVGAVGDEFPQFLFAFHGQAVGPFGAMVKGKYTGGPF